MKFSRLTSKQRKGLIIAVIAAGGFLAVFIPVMILSTPNLPSAATLAITRDNPFLSADFNYTSNTSRDISYKLSIPAGMQVNITFRNKNGTQLRTSISRMQAQSQCWWSYDQCLSISGPNDFPTSPYAPTNFSVIFTALADTTLCLAARAIAYNTATAKIYRWNETGGSIFVQATPYYDATLIPPSETGFYNYNLTNSNAIEYFKEFSVGTSGYYLIRSNASRAIPAIATNPNADIRILLKGEGIASDISARISGAAREIARITHAGTNPSYNRYTIAYLDGGRTYILRYASHGFVNATTWELIRPVAGTINPNGVILNFTSSATTVFNDVVNNRNIMFVDFATALQYHVLYDIKVSGDYYPSGRTAVGLFSGDTNWDWRLESSSYWFPGGKSANLLFLNDPCDPLAKDGQFQTRNHKYFSNRPAFTWSNNISITPNWQTLSVNRAWQMDHQLVAVWVTPSATPTNVNLTIMQNVAGVPTFPGTNTNGVYNTTFTFRNDGVPIENGVGIYKIAGARDFEFQAKITQMDQLFEPQAVFNFYTAKETRGARNNASTPGTSFTFRNNTRTWGGVNPDWDSPVVWEIGLMEDPVYVLFTGTFQAGTWPTNITQFTMEYTFEPFLDIGKPFLVSRDNTIQFFHVANIPASASLQAVIEYGACCIEISASSNITLLTPCPCFITDPLFAGSTWSYSSMYPSVKGFPVNFGSYIIWKRANLVDAAGGSGSNGYFDGTVLRFTLNNTGTDWVAWGCFIGAAAALGVVGIMFWKHKFIRVR